MAIDSMRTSPHEQYPALPTGRLKSLPFQRNAQGLVASKILESPVSITETGTKVMGVRGCRSRLSLWLGAIVFLMWNSQALAQTDAA